MSAHQPSAYERQYLTKPNPVPSLRSATSDLFDRPHKVVHILNGSVDSVIYRVEIGSFNLLCRNICVLFKGKANELFWRCHSQWGNSVGEFCERVRYLGHIIGEGGIRTGPQKVAGIADFPLRKSLKSVRSVRVLCGWYRKLPNSFCYS